MSRLLALVCVLSFGVSVGYAQVPGSDSTEVDDGFGDDNIIGPEAIDAATLDTVRNGDILPGERDELKNPELAPGAPPPPDTGRNFFGRIFQPGYPNPERAAALSFVLPGAGQIYNKRFWYIKLPIIYGGYVGLILAGEFNRGIANDFDDYIDAFSNGDALQTGTPVDGFTNLNQFQSTQEPYSKRYQLSYIGVVVLHFVQTLEAYTTAHLLNFDMDESLSLYPTLLPPAPNDPSSGGRLGLGMTVHLGAR